MGEMEGMILFDLDDAGGQEQRKRTKAAGCPFTVHVKTRSPQMLLLRCWRRMLMVRLHEWAGLWRDVIDEDVLFVGLMIWFGAFFWC